MNRDLGSRQGVDWRFRVRQVLCAASAVAVVTTVAHSAHANPNYACIPPAVGVFGLDGPPDWTAAGVAAHLIGRQLDDPRWNGSMRDDLPQFGGSTMPQSAFRALQDGSKLYLTFREIVDPDGTTSGWDAVYLGFASATTGSAKLVRFKVNANDVQDTTDVVSTAWRKPAATAWTTFPFPAWVEEAHVWAGTGTGTAGAAWAVNVRIDLAGLHADPDIGGGIGSNVRMFYAVDDYTHISPPPMTNVTTVWPLGTAFGFTGCPTACVPDSTMDPTLWGTAVIGTADPSCPTGISLVAEHIGTMPVTAGIPATRVEYGGDAGATNTFVAAMDNPPASTSTVKANFRLADWGSQIGDSTADWKSIIPTGASMPINDVAADRVYWSCHETTGALDSCPTLPNATAPPDQCLLVELSSTGGISPVHFVHDSARRNLDFVHASQFTRDARISVNGLTPLLGGGGQRDVYIYVKTTNMPAKPGSPPPVDAGAPADAAVVQDAAALQDAGIGQTAGMPRDAGIVIGRKAGNVSRGKGPPIYQKTVFESLRDSSPTYEVHVYHTTGRKINEGSGDSEILEPQVAFGYLVDHSGTIDGWRHRLQGKGIVLEEISPNFFHVKVPDNGSVVVNTTIEAVEPAPPCPPRVPHGHHCNCDVVGSNDWSPLAVAVAGFGGSALVVRSRRRRRDGFTSKKS
jgi:hypothetical protein